MSSKQEPKMGLYYGYESGESGWEAQIDSNFLKIGVVMQLAVLSRSLTAAPVSPANGDCYIVPAGATGGGWETKAQRVAIWRNEATAWEFYQPSEGWTAVITTEGTYGKLSVFKSGTWSPGLTLA